jgi:hypothetical protein
VNQHVMKSTVLHLLGNVFPAATDYEVAEERLTEAYKTNPDAGNWDAEARMAIRRASELAIAIDGLTDRAHHALNLSKKTIRADVSALCVFPGTTSLRPGAFERVRGVANVYKHKDLNDPDLPITSDADVLTVAMGYGLEGWGVGKFAGVEVIVRDKAGQQWKFMGDVPTVIGAWISFLNAKGAFFQANLIRFVAFECKHESNKKS